MDKILNVFQTVRPRGADMPGPAPRALNVGRPPMSLKGSHQRVLDRTGKLSVPLAPRMGTLVVEGQKAGQAANDRRRALIRGGL